MKNHLLVALASCCLLAVASRAELEPRKAGDPEPPKYKFPAYAPIVENPRLPRVLLLGDSISIGYHLMVRQRLDGLANVLRPPENCADTGTGLEQLDKWLAMGTGKWAVIHFNFGLHDLKYLDAKGNYVSPDKGKQVTSVTQYEANLRVLVERLKRTGAHLIFATTTPVPAGSLGRVEGDEQKYNDAAKRVMRAAGVEVDDLCALVSPRQTTLQVPHNVHFSTAGYEAMADSAVALIKPALPPPKPALKGP